MRPGSPPSPGRYSRPAPPMSAPPRSRSAATCPHPGPVPGRCWPAWPGAEYVLATGLLLEEGPMPGGRSGNGWVTCAQGHQHWGLFGAAGLLVYVPHPPGPAQSQVLVQRRSRWAHHGGTWALPGGAMDSDETPAEAALREADQECMLDPKLVLPRGMHADDHGGWGYHTVLAQ